MIARSGCWGLLLLAMVACDGEGAKRREARRFLQAYGDLSQALGESDRRARLEALKSLPLHGEVASEARDVCVKAHEALLDAEAQQSAAARMFDDLLDGAGGEPLAPQKTEPVRERIERSERALAEAREHHLKCEDAARALAVRFAER